jgi:hypothetical protein
MSHPPLPSVPLAPPAARRAGEGDTLLNELLRRGSEPRPEADPTKPE